MTKSRTEIPLLTGEDAEKVLSNPPGGPVLFRMPEAVIVSHRARLRAAFPDTVLEPIPPKPDEWVPGYPRAYDREDERIEKFPSFRALPPVQRVPELEPPGGGYTLTYVGSGVRASEHPIAKGWFSRCMRCASDDTRVIYASSSRHHGHFEDWVWMDWEYECAECRSFTYARSRYVR